MLEFLEAAHSHLTTICQQCRYWVQSVAETTSVKGQAVGGIGKREEDDRTRFTDLLGELFMSVQRVMVRHRECAAITEENRGVLCYSCAVLIGIVYMCVCSQMTCWSFHAVYNCICQPLTT